jgi:putative chitobiose transport system substrate-binding protein
MRTHRIIALTALVALVVGACSGATPSSPPAVPSSPSAAASVPAASPSASTAVESTAPSASPSEAPLAADPAEAVIPNVEQGSTITFWTFFLSPTFDQYIKDTIARFEATYPGVTVKWEDHQGTFKDDLNAAYAANIPPDVINLSVSEGWVSEYAGKNVLLPLTDTNVPKTVQDIYFPGLWNEQLVDGVNFQFPWYQGLNVELINKALYDQTGLTLDQFPKTIDGLPQLCQTVLDKTGTVCAIRLTVNDLLAQMVYEGNVKVFNSDSTAFAFNSPEGVAWLQMYVDMVKAGTVDNTILTTNDDRVGLNAFAAGAAAFYATGPNLARTVKASNATLYGNLAMLQAPLGKSGVSGKGLMSISVNKTTKAPNASIALAQFFTNPRSMVQFAKQVAVYPSSASAYDDPFFSEVPSAIEDSARPIAGSIVATYADIVPTVPNKADVNQIVLAAVQSALFNNVSAQDALDKAVTDANKLLLKK